MECDFCQKQIVSEIPTAVQFNDNVLGEMKLRLEYFQSRRYMCHKACADRIENLFLIELAAAQNRLLVATNR